MGTAELETISGGADSGILADQPPASRGQRWLWPAGLITAGVVLFFAYLAESWTVPVMSDGASDALQAWEMLHGNLLLHGWSLGHVSFYTTELPEYALIEAVHGLNAGSAHIASALTYTLVLIGAALLAKGRAGGREGLVRAVLAGGIMVAPVAHTQAATTLVSNPDHIGTQVPLLLMWLILDRARPRWFVPVIVAALLAVVQIADQLATYEGALALMLVCAIRLYLRRDAVLAWKPGDPSNEKLRESWYELSLGAGAIVSVGVAGLALRLIQHAGGFATQPNVTVFTTVASLYSHVWVTLQSVLVLFGADFSGDRLGVPAAIAVVHLVGVALAGWAFARALRRFTSCELVVQVLAVTAVVLLVSYMLDGDYSVLQGTHEISGVLPVGAVLASRLLADQLIRYRHLPALGVVLGCYLLVLAHSAVQPPGYNPNSQLASWLQAHHLDYGLATYWNASVVTVDTGGSVQVVPVDRSFSTGRVASAQWNAKASWYDPRLHDARFLVLPARSGCTNGTPSQFLAAARATFGPPVATYRAVDMVIWVWDKNLLDHVLKPVGPC